MNAIALIISAALTFGLVALGVLLWQLNSGQLEDLKGAANRILLDDDERDVGD